MCIIAPSSGKLPGELFQVPRLIVRFTHLNTLNSFDILSSSVKILWSFIPSSTRVKEVGMHRECTGIVKGKRYYRIIVKLGLYFLDKGTI